MREHKAGKKCKCGKTALENAPLQEKGERGVEKKKQVCPCSHKQMCLQIRLSLSQSLNIISITNTDITYCNFSPPSSLPTILRQCCSCRETNQMTPRSHNPEALKLLIADYLFVDMTY